MERGRPALFPLPDGRADPRFLRLPVGTLRGEDRRLARPAGRRGDRHLSPARARVRPRLDGRRGQGRTRLRSAAFAPYQYRQFRIVEFPRYASFAQSFPNTIPFSEAIGFIARVRSRTTRRTSTIPTTSRRTRSAHQWWAHQVIGADVQGGTMLVESLAQYSALMVMKRKFGAAKMRRFLGYELDGYLRGRASSKKELPLSRVKNQPYIHYNKGSLVMYALADYIGEDNLNRALRAFRDAHAFKGPPYPNTTELIARIREVTPPEMQSLIDDLFNRIVVWDNRAVSATMKAVAGGRWEVTMEVVAKKRVAEQARQGRRRPARRPDRRRRRRRQRRRDRGGAQAPDERAVDLHDDRRQAAGEGRHRPVEQADRPQARRQHDRGVGRIGRTAPSHSLAVASQPPARSEQRRAAGPARPTASVCPRPGARPALPALGP